MNTRISQSLFQNSDCLETDTLLLYAQGKLDKAAAHAAEMHLTDCPLCSEAVEGIQLMHSQGMMTEAEFRSSLSEIGERVLPQAEGAGKGRVVDFAARTQPSRLRKVILWTGSIAAALVLLVVSWQVMAPAATDHFTDQLKTMATRGGEADPRAQEADQAQENEQYADAARLYESLGNQPVYVFNAGLSYFKMKSYDKAAEKFAAVSALPVVTQADADARAMADFNRYLSLMLSHQFDAAYAVLTTVAGDPGHRYKSDAMEGLATFDADKASLQ